MKVNFYATLRAFVGQKTVELSVSEPCCALDLARLIADRWPRLADQLFDTAGEISAQIQFLIDGRNVRWLPDRGATIISTSDVIDIFPPTAGG